MNSIDIGFVVYTTVLVAFILIGIGVDYFTKERQKKLEERQKKHFSIEVYDPESENIYLRLHFHEKICPTVDVDRYMSLGLLKVR